MKDFQEKLDEKYAPMAIITSSLNANMKLVIPKDSLQVFIDKTNKAFTYEGFTAVNDTMIQLR
ncbi:hypothetical protein [Kordia sp.]|uniref:hypothetical protein n=1 Tax=Kordia sp. TaxID=1965332 RepID=UPI0025B8D2D9|nr:hypothetical protein [Kordia sp.]MCH2196013.1 hypothetical protein [Kordia sp.]